MILVVENDKIKLNDCVEIVEDEVPALWSNYIGCYFMLGNVCTEFARLKIKETSLERFMFWMNEHIQSIEKMQWPQSGYAIDTGDPEVPDPLRRYREELSK